MMSYEAMQKRSALEKTNPFHRRFSFLSRDKLPVDRQGCNVDRANTQTQHFSTPPLGGRNGIRERRDKLSGRRGGLDAVRSVTISKAAWFVGGTTVLTSILSLIRPDLAGYVLASGFGSIFGTLVAVGFVVWLTSLGIKNCNKIIDRIDRILKK